jgi:hypothetical protein
MISKQWHNCESVGHNVRSWWHMSMFNAHSTSQQNAHIHFPFISCGASPVGTPVTIRLSHQFQATMNVEQSVERELAKETKATLSTTSPILPDLGSNPGHRGVKAGNNSYFNW